MALVLLVICVFNAPADTAKRIVVVGDIHADLGVARHDFRPAGGIDENDNRIGG